MLYTIVHFLNFSFKNYHVAEFGSSYVLVSPCEEWQSQNSVLISRLFLVLENSKYETLLLVFFLQGLTCHGIKTGVCYA